MTIWAAWSPDWSLYDKVDFDGINKIIYVHPEVTELDIRRDIYTSWVDWINLRDNVKFLPAIRVTGLDPIGGGVFTGDVYFLINGWKLSVNLQNVKITGVLYSDDFDTAYYTPSMVAQYPVSVSALVTTVSTGSGSGGTSGPTAAQIRAEIDANSVKLNSIKNTVDVIPTQSQIASSVWGNSTRTLTTSASGATLAEIEASSILAKKSDVVEVRTITQNLPTNIWNTPISSHTDKTTFGGFISKVLLSIPKFLGLK